VRLALLTVLLAAIPCAAQDLPDPGRRLSPEEQNADPEKRSVVEKATAREPRYGGRAKNPQACENTRLHYQLSCGAPHSRRSYGQGCAEAYALYRQSCP
jgi:hypothetical protein